MGLGGESGAGECSDKTSDADVADADADLSVATTAVDADSLTPSHSFVAGSGRTTLSGPLNSPSIPIPSLKIDTEGHAGISAYDFRILALVSAAYEYVHSEYGCSPASTCLHVEHEGE